jgi:MFS family permease
LPFAAASSSRASSGDLMSNTWRWCRGLPGQHPALCALLVAITLFSIVAVGPLELFVPLYGVVLVPGQPFRSGLFMATGGLGLLVGALWALRLVHRPRVGAWLCGCAVTGGILLVAVTYAPTALAFALLFAAGITGGVFNSLCLAGIQVRAPALLRGRVLGLYTLVLGGSPAVGGFIAGKLLHHVDVPLAMRWIFGAATALFIALYLVLPALRTRASAAVAD